MTTEQVAPDVRDDQQRRAYRRLLSWLLLAGAPLIGFGLFWFVNFGGVDSPAWSLVVEHFAAIIGLPAGAVAALFIVMMLEQTHGRIEFEGLGFKFRGASGPVVLWVLCYLAIAASLKLLW